MIVNWTEDALDKLADRYVEMSSDERNEVAGAVEALNRQLSWKADQVGESRQGWVRIVFIPHLIVYFELSPQDDSVTVTDVFYLRPRGRK